MINASKDTKEKSEDKAGELTYEDYKKRGLSSPGLILRAIDTPFMGVSWFEYLTAILQVGQLLCIYVCFPAQWILSEKVSTLRGKNLLPMGANSFLLE